MTPVPVASGERIETLDVLRGFALLGILAMNIRAMAAPFSAYMYPYALFDFTGASRAAYIFTSVVFDLKMMGLFSMLFGAGVLLYAAKPTESGQPPRGLWFRRMFWLLVIGLVHAYLIWDGDILVPYALCGLLLLWWVRRLQCRRAARWPARRVLLVGVLLSVGHGIGVDDDVRSRARDRARDVDADARAGEPAARTDARQLRRGRRASRPVRVHGADDLLRALLLLAMRRNDAARHGAVQVGFSRRSPRRPATI